MLEEACEALRRDAVDPRLPETVRQAAGSALASLEAYLRIRLARAPTDPAGHALVKPRST